MLYQVAPPTVYNAACKMLLVLNSASNLISVWNKAYLDPTP